MKKNISKIEKKINMEDPEKKSNEKKFIPNLCKGLIFLSFIVLTVRLIKTLDKVEKKLSEVEDLLTYIG